MALVSRTEFAAICFTDVKKLNVYVSRKKVATVNGNKSLIDTLNPLNIIFARDMKKLYNEKIEHGRALKRKPKSTPKIETVAQPEVKDIKKEIEKLYDEVVEKYTPDETPTQKKAREKQNEEDGDVVSWDLRRKIAEAIKAEQAVELSRIQIDKLNGRLMPVDLVEAIIKVNIQNIFKSFENELINIASVYCDILAGGDRIKLSELITKMRKNLEYIISSTEKVAGQEIENVIEEYTEVRSRGERK